MKQRANLHRGTRLCPSPQPKETVAALVAASLRSADYFVTLVTLVTFFRLASLGGIWKQELQDDQNHLVELLHASKQIGPERDRKLQALKDRIRQKISQSINPGNRKILVFTAFADTANYLYGQIADWAKAEFGVHSALVTGTGTIPNRTTMANVRTDLHSLLTNFSPRSKERHAELTEEIDLLFTTDCISEGQNLQDCDYLVNYDIHWNPVRIIQRFGRIDRIGSTNSAIQLVNFWPNMELDEYIRLEARVSGRMVLLDISATGEENVIEFNDKTMNDLEYRRKQLQQLQGTVLDLENLSGGISITDLTLNDFRMDLTAYMKEHQPLLDRTPFGARAAATLELTFLKQEFRPGAIFCLKDMSGQAPLATGYSLAPYYLVFVSDEGQIQLNFTQPRQILDVLKKECVGFSSPQATPVSQFNQRTQGGKDMSHYQRLLEKAVDAIVGQEQEQGIQTLFQPGGIRLAGDASRRLDDFEVVAFIALLRDN